MMCWFLIPRAEGDILSLIHKRWNAPFTLTNGESRMDVHIQMIELWRSKILKAKGLHTL